MSMPDRDRRAMELFQAVIELPEEAREAWLSEQTGGDPELQSEVESLIAAHERTAGILESPLLQPEPVASEEDEIEAIKRSVGKD